MAEMTPVEQGRARGDRRLGAVSLLLIGVMVGLLLMVWTGPISWYFADTKYRLRLVRNGTRAKGPVTTRVTVGAPNEPGYRATTYRNQEYPFFQWHWELQSARIHRQ
jgi:hypothetical protein